MENRRAKKEGLPERNIKDCGRNVRFVLSWLKKRLWNVAKKRMLEDRRVLPKEDGNQLREYEAMHEENFLISWLREDVEGGKVDME